MELKEKFLEQLEVEVEAMQISADTEEATDSAKASITADLMQGAIVLIELLKEGNYKKEALSELQQLLIEEQEEILFNGI